MVLLNKEVIPRVRPGETLTIHTTGGDSHFRIYSEHHYNLDDELRIKMSANGRIFIGRVIEVKTNTDNENSYTFALNENKRDWFRETVQNALGGPPGR